MVALYGKKYVVPLNVLAVFMCVSDCLCHFRLDSRYRYIDKPCFEMKILNYLARNCVCLSYLFKHVRIYITRHPLSSASLE